MIAGLTIIPDYITPEQEQELLAYIKPFSDNINRQGGRRNTIKRYGSNLPYNGRMVSKVIPEHFNWLLQKLVDDGIVAELPDSITVNEYKKGQGIDYHIDSKKSGPVIVVLSLMGAAKMHMRKKPDVEIYKVPARALTILKDEARTDWEHSIPHVQEPRLSLVFRKGTKI